MLATKRRFNEKERFSDVADINISVSDDSQFYPLSRK